MPRAEGGETTAHETPSSIWRLNKVVGPPCAQWRRVAPGYNAGSPPPPPAMPLTRSDFHYHLPRRLIAQAPLPERSASRLLQVGADALAHRRFAELPRMLRPGDVLVLNDTRVVKARMAALKDTGGRAELLFERLESECEALCQARISKPLQAGRRLVVGGEAVAVVGRVGDFYRLRFPRPVLEFLAAHGQTPLPPYIRRAANGADAVRYQTVYATQPGAVAAPTAGLHFDTPLLDAIAASGVVVERLTLHVGAGTFQPLRGENLAEHQMHSERYVVPAAVAQAVNERQGRVVAVGTTVARALESAAADDGRVAAGAGETTLFIAPGYRFKVVDALVTNFHLPESSLLALVSAFAGHQRILGAYAAAVAAEYRFHSYGDAMFCERAPPAEGGP